MLEKIEETKTFLAPLLEGKEHPLGIILGTGLGGLRDEIATRHDVPYSRIPGFPRATVEGHAGHWIVGELAGCRVIAMQGRFHYYEGYSMQTITFPVRVMRALGVRALVVSNAAGGLNPGFRAGDLMLITDHVNLFPEHPLRGSNDERLGPRFPVMAGAYSPRLRSLATRAAENLGIPVHQGVYAGVQGPSFETHAECHWIRGTGADAVGMSTVPEVIVARHAGIDCLGISVIANCHAVGEASHHEVQEAGHAVQPRLSALVREFTRLYVEMER
jgi:purine-nucleoside phosphorylase